MISFIAERLGTIIQDAEIKGNKLVTKNFKSMIKGKVKGILIAVVRPVALETI